MGRGKWLPYSRDLAAVWPAKGSVVPAMSLVSKQAGCRDWAKNTIANINFSEVERIFSILFWGFMQLFAIFFVAYVNSANDFE